MKKEDIKKKIFEIKTDKELIDFVKFRIQELENSSIEVTVGQNYTDTFKEYLSSKIHYKAGDKIGINECPDLVYDDITPYVELVKTIKENQWYNELTLFSTIFYEIYYYLPSNDFGLGRAMTYIGNMGKRISIKTIKDNGCAFCSEKSGMSHNMFKFLGIDSEIACGYRNKEKHAFNIIYPKGYGNEPMIIYDPSFFVSFFKENKKFTFGYFKALNKEEYEKLLNGEEIKIDLLQTQMNYRKLYNLDDSYLFEGDESTYALLTNKNELINHNNENKL